MNYNKSLLVANWKMHKTIATTKDFVRSMQGFGHIDHHNIVICPPITLHTYLADLPFALGAQDCSELSVNEGAFTGDISAAMLKDVGCSYVIIGHSERRSFHHEKAESLKQKAYHAHNAGLQVILCIGEDLSTREQGNYLDFLTNQLKECLPDSANSANLIIAYEPIWAIGSGKAASFKQIEEVHQFLQKQGFAILYGGSVNATNAGEILAIPYVSGLLIGGASLDANKFNEIIQIRGKSCN